MVAVVPGMSKASAMMVMMIRTKYSLSFSLTLGLTLTLINLAKTTPIKSRHTGARKPEFKGKGKCNSVGSEL